VKDNKREEIAYERHLEKAFNHQRKAVEFARILWRATTCRKIRAECKNFAEIYVKAFGPPEVLKWRSLKLLYWNFRRKDGAMGFSVFVALPIKAKFRGEITFSVATRSRLDEDWEQFLVWLWDTVGKAEHSEEAPRFLNGAGFVIVPAERLAHS
jgi:hypothetical protein